MKFTDYYFKEELKVDALSQMKAKIIYDVPVVVNPSRDEFTSIMKNPLSDLGNFNAVKIGFIDGDVYVWPFTIFHVDMFESLKTNHIIETNKNQFDFSISYTNHSSELVFTDKSINFKSEINKKRFVDKFDSTFKYLSVNNMIDNMKSVTIFNLDDYRSKDVEKVEPVLDLQEPKYAKVIRRFHKDEF